MGADCRQRDSDEFKAEAVKQVTERSDRVAKVAGRLGVSRLSLYPCGQARRDGKDGAPAHSPMCCAA